MTDFAPVVVFAYKREDKIMKCIEALENNDCHQYVDLYIFADGNKDTCDKNQVEAVRKYLMDYKNRSTFKSINIEFRDKNYGLANNVINGVTSVIVKHGCVVVVEDDLIVDRDFICYINNALSYYKSHSNIWSVTGYTEPLKSLKHYRHNVYYGYRGCSYGWGTWVDRWQTVDWQIRDYSDFLRNRKKQWKLNRSGNSMTRMLNLQMQGGIDSWAIRWCYAQSMQNKFTVYPTSSFLTDIGSDGSGTHRGKSETANNNLHIYGDNICFETLKPDIFITVDYWYTHSDTPLKKLRRNRYLKLIKNIIIK